MSDKKASNQMWGGRFASGPAAIMEAINASIGFDKKLYAQDIAGSHRAREMLAEQGIISADDQRQIAHGLNTILSEIEAGTFEFSTRLEDIHMNVEARLAELIGPAAGRLHTARSRNDQVAVDFRLWVKAEALRTARALQKLIAAFLDKAEEHAETVMPGFTHLQSGAAGDLRPSLHGLCRDVLPRPVRACATPSSAWTRARWALRRWPAPASRSTGTRLHRRSAFASRQGTRSTASPTAISRWNSCRSRRSARCTCRGWPKRSSSGRRRNSVSCGCRTAFPPAPRSCRRRRTRTPPNWCAPRPAASTAT